MFHSQACISLVLSLSAYVSLACARQIAFPPVAAHPPWSPEQERPELQYRAFQEDPFYGASGKLGHVPAFSGLQSFANLPYVPCLSDKGVEVEPYDVAILGAPFDTGVTGRPGARFGPKGIRSGSWRIHPESAYDIFTGENVFDLGSKVVDCGDAPLLDEAHKIVSSRNTTAKDVKVPRIVTLGGDHTTTLPALRSVAARWGPVSVIHFDSHIDTWNPEVLGGGLSHYAGVNHGTFLHIAHEEGLILNSSVHVGIRAPLDAGKRDLRNDKRCGFSIIGARSIDRIGVQGIVDRINQTVKGNVYISVDIDVLDPAFAPATGTAEVGGWSTRELLTILDSLHGLPVVGADVVEVAPIYDNAGETTVLAAAEIAKSLIGLIARTHVAPQFTSSD